MLEKLQEKNAGLVNGVHRSMEKADVRAVALSYVDNSGISRVKAIPIAKLDSALNVGVGMSPVFDAFLFDDSITQSKYSGGPMGDLRMFPDLGSIAAIAGAPGWAWAPVSRFCQDGTEYGLCHRSFVARMTESLLGLGISSKMSFEIEWVVSKSGRDALDLDPACSGPAYGLERIVELGDYCLEILHALDVAQVVVEQIHPEYAPGQFEISVAPLDPVRAADVSVLVKHIIRVTSARHGLRASFAPSVAANGVGNGGHLHFSFFRGGNNLFSTGSGREKMTEEGESILAGILAELPALCAIGAPSVGSYFRLVPQRWAGAYRCWGVDNREAALRFIPSTALVSSDSANAELKPFDLSSSPYLTTGSVLAVAAHYFDKSLKLGDPVEVDPASLEPIELKLRGIERLPTSVTQALGCLNDSDVLTKALGEKLLVGFTAVRRSEVELLADRSIDEVISVTRWKY